MRYGGENVKKDKEDIVEEALSNMSLGYTCSESIVLAMSKHLKIKINVIPKIATGFSAGIGRMGDVCGAISGGVMIIGLIYGRLNPNDTERYEKCIGKVQKLIMEFKNRNGEIDCEKLIGLKLSRAEDREKFRVEKVKERFCMKFVKDVINILMGMLDEGEGLNVYG
jgi:C_GCAxxG_C_C family probable redox protein